MAAQEHTQGSNTGNPMGSSSTRQKAYKVVWRDVSETTQKCQVGGHHGSEFQIVTSDTLNPDEILTNWGLGTMYD